MVQVGVQNIHQLSECYAYGSSLTVMCFVRDSKSMTVLLMLDNTSAVRYMHMYANKLGGTVSHNLTAITKDL